MPISQQIGSSSLAKPGVCTSTTRPATPYEGQMIYETDTDRILVWNGSAWYANWNLPWGVLDKIKVTTNTAISGTTATTITSLTVVGISGRLYKVSSSFYFLLGGTGYGVCQIFQGGVQAQEATFDRSSGQFAYATPFTYTTFTGSTTFSTRFAANVGGTHTVYGNAQYPHILIIEDIGPA